MGKKCSVAGCFEDAVCRDAKCAQHTAVYRDKAEHGTTGGEPRTSAPHLGVEIECVARDHTAYKAINSQFIRGEHDGSLPELGCEFKLCYPVEKCITRAPAFASRLRVAGAQVHRRCGLHVHLDARDIKSVRQLAFLKWLQLHQDSFWSQLVPSGRWNCEYVKAITDANLDRHYTWAHPTPHRTVEIRLHPGTLNPHKIRGWLHVCADLLQFLRDTSKYPDLASLASPCEFKDVPVPRRPTMQRVPQIGPDGQIHMVAVQTSSMTWDEMLAQSNMATPTNMATPRPATPQKVASESSSIWSPLAKEYLDARLNAGGILRIQEEANPCAA